MGKWRQRTDAWGITDSGPGGPTWPWQIYFGLAVMSLVLGVAFTIGGPLGVGLLFLFAGTANGWLTVIKRRRDTAERAASSGL